MYLRRPPGRAFLLDALNLEPDRAHELDTIALGDHSIPESEIEPHPPLDQLVLEMDIAQSAGRQPADIRERQVVVEAVSTRSAISTYNILFAEQRPVAAALIAVERAR